MALLSPAEQAFHAHYVKLKLGHLSDTVLRHLPQLHASLPEEAYEGPALHKHVFIRVLRTIESYMPPKNGGDEPLKLNAGAGMVLAYDIIRELIVSGDVELA